MALLLCGVSIGLGIDAASQMLAVRRTGHFRDCPGLRGWDCTCAR